VSGDDSWVSGQLANLGALFSALVSEIDP
jgi:hypothetical protein